MRVKSAAAATFRVAAVDWLLIAVPLMLATWGQSMRVEFNYFNTAAPHRSDAFLTAAMAQASRRRGRPENPHKHSPGGLFTASEAGARKMGCRSVELPLSDVLRRRARNENAEN
jgi:hypothetical protein